MKIAIGADHAGFELKQKIRDHLQSRGVDVLDKGTDSPESCDYPDYALKVTEDVVGGWADLGILVCGTGIGMSMAANKVPGIRAARAVSEIDAQLSREHNDANVLTLGARVTGSDLAINIVDVWLKTPFLGGRHARRVGKMSDIEKLETAPANRTS
ncbi:MAG TPA: ribose 5-phosphate isomerase B [Terriglobales bacterium]|nr:ribose 5-phosphate isomerase B [Terriglobales bacterium]